MEIPLYKIADQLCDAVNFADGIEDAVFGLSELSGTDMRGVLALLRHHVSQLEALSEFVSRKHHELGGGKVVVIRDRKAVRQ